MSKLQRLRDNIAAIECALTGKGDAEVLGKYSGFGGMNFMLNPTGDKSAWTKSDQPYYDDALRLRQMLVKAAGNGNKFDAWLQSLKASVLTAFYTPFEIPVEIFKCVYGMKHSFYDKGVYPKTILDPAAGGGVFLRALGYASLCHPQPRNVVAYEKDLLTGLILNKRIKEYFMDGCGTAVHSTGFETIPAEEMGKFDLVATNVPFGDITVFDPEYSRSKSAVRREAAKMIHRYYVLKGLDCLRDGGIEAYIITSNYLNRDGEQLAEALRQARLIGAYRLANNLFKESGTEVGTDLLVLQKDSRKEGLAAEESWLLTQYEDSGCPTNMYFDMKPEHVIATDWTVDTDAYGKRALVYHHRDGVAGISKQMGEVLSKDLAENFDAGLYRDGETRRSARPQRDACYQRDARTAGHGGNGGCDTAAHSTKKAAKKQRPAKAPRKERMMKAIHKCYTMLYEYEATKMECQRVWRKRLNRLHDAFVGEYGVLHKAENVKVAKRLGIEEVTSLEEWDKQYNRWQKADIFNHPVSFSTDSEPVVMTAQEALARSLNECGWVNILRMEELTGKDEDELVSELEGDIYFNPMEYKYEIKARFVSGNVIEKLEQMKEAKAKIEQMRSPMIEQMAHIDRSIAALEDAIPTPIPFEDLDFNLGERWMDVQVYADFASEFFSMPEDATKSSYWSGRVEVTVKYNALLDEFAASASSRNEKIWSQYSISSEATKSLDGIELLVHALKNTCPKMMKYQRDAQGRCMYNDKGEHLKTEDPEKTQLANAKIEEIRQGFQDWLVKQPKEWKDEITAIYNRKFNCFVKPQYDGSHQTFPGVDWAGLEAKYEIPQPQYDAKGKKLSGGLYKSQEDCVWMLVQNGGGICDHEVGSGKTLIMCVAAHEMKRLGLVHKPMIIGLKANVGAIAETYRTAYPQAKVLYAGEADYKGEAGRVNFLNRAKNNDWDCIIMSHDSFGRIPQSADIEKALIKEEMQQLDESIKSLYGDSGTASTKIRKKLEKRKQNREAKLKSVLYRIKERSDDAVDFRMMGVDHIFVDESHMYKNLSFTTKHDRVAGVGNTKGSQKADNLLMAIRTIQQRTGRDLGATFLSGTTVTNSLTELYSLFRYLRPQALKKQGITCFDAWAAIFTKKSSEYEFSITNQIILKERFRYFIKVPELAMFYNEITDFRTAEDVGIDRPKKHTMLLNLKPTPDQERYIKVLMDFARTGDFSLIGMPNPTDQQQKAKMLYATDKARKMSLDMRLIDEAYSDHPNSKASQCAKNIKAYYDLYSEQKGVQLVFSDLSAYDPKKWNIYSEIKRHLIEDYGIPAKEIRFIQECKCESKKNALIAAVNRGEVRVLFGSTQMLGTGVNAQQRVVAVHHLDTPWRPSDLEQRDGRAIRKGNEVAKQYAGNQVDIIIYAVERSLDSYKFNLLHCKQTFINQLKRGQLSIRTLDEGVMDEKTGANFAEFMAVLSGNTDLLERAKLEKKIAGLEAEKKTFAREKADQEQKRERLVKDCEALERNIESVNEDWERFFAERGKAGALVSTGEYVNKIEIDGFEPREQHENGSYSILTAENNPDDYQKSIGQELLRIQDTARTDGKHVTIGSVYGFPISVKTTATTVILDGKQLTDYTNQFYVSGQRLIYIVNRSGRLNRSSATASALLPLQTLQRLPDMADSWQQQLSENRQRIDQLTAIIANDWPKDDALKRLRADLAMLDRRINKSIHSDEQQQMKQAA